MPTARVTGRPTSMLRDRGWLMLALLLGAVIVPTACILWFMNEAVASQTAAARQTVLEAYRGQLRSISRQLNRHWQTRASDLDRIGTRGTAADFKKAIADRAADSIIFLDASGSVIYPRTEDPGHAPSREPGGGDDPALHAALALAADVLALELPRPDLAGLRRTRVADVWQLASETGRVIALYREETVHTAQHHLVDERQSDVVEFAIFPPGEGAYEEAVAVGPSLPGWQASFALLDVDALEQPARARVASYLWVGVLGIGLFAVSAIGLGHTFRRQLRVTRLKTDLVAAVSHELRTPLASMRLLVDALLQDETFDPTKTREYLDLIATENSRLTRLIDNFLTFSRLERHRHQFSFGATRPADVVHAAVDAMRARRRVGGEMDVAIAPDLPRLHADADALAMALLNLLDNAHKYTPGDKHIAVRAFADRGDVVFAVQDNGIGIPAGEQKRIFRRFYRVDRRLSRATTGVGLGLSIVDEIVRAHRGTVHVDSDAGQGSTFTVRLPAAAGADA